MSIAAKRAVEVKSKGKDGNRVEGSGYLIAPRLILTAGHNIIPNSEVEVRILGDSFKSRASDLRHPKDLLRSAKVLFPEIPTQDGNDDFALLVTQNETSPGDDPIDWISVPDTGGLEFSAIGFPLYAIFAHFPSADEARRLERDTLEISGRAFVTENLKQRELYNIGGLRLYVHEELRPDNVHGWEGFSGAAVFSKGHLIGVVTRAWDTMTLNCFPASRIFNHAGVVDAVKRAGLRLPRDVLSHANSSDPKVFLCHASEDKDAVRSLYRELKRLGFTPWLDEEDLIPGLPWDAEITKAIRASHVVLVCLSKRSEKRGYVQKEIVRALDLADEQPEGTIFVIPVRLEDCSVPERLKRWQWVNLYEPNGLGRLRGALETVARALSQKS